MRLHRLAVTAFGPFAGTQDIDFEALSTAGIFLLHGPTGAGKTSVLDAVCFALYGGVPGARQSPAAVLRSDHADPGTLTEVCLELTVAGRRLEVTRSPAQQRPKRKGAGYTTVKASSTLREYDRRSGTWRALSRTHQEIGKEITELLGMSREQFCQVVLLPQGDFARFLRADAEERAALLGRLFDTKRFAAVEERLAEQRRAAEQQVRSGDERLLSLAQRMAQAAGEGVAGPLPEARPGDAGLASGLLVWAALARSAAAERAESAACAVGLAEERVRRARAGLEAETELARLQQRFADTRRRAEELEAGRAPQEQAQELLDTDRRAERVTPALGLRDEAEGAHRAAAAARRGACAPLEPALAEAGTDHLAALERTVREEVGTLESARAAEARGRRIAGELARLDHQGEADEEVLRESAAWLDTWETREGDLRRRLEEAQEAATRAEALAGRLEPARARLEAARRRDRLAKSVAAAEREALAAGRRAVAAHEHWLGLRERRLAGMAAELAAGLSPGAPCAVCGSPEHPAPARPAEGQVDAAAEDAASEAHRHAERARQAADAAQARVREEYAAAQAEAGDAPVRELAELATRLADEHAGAHAAAAGTHAAREALTRASAEYEQRRTVRADAERRIAARTSQRDTLERELAEIHEELVRARRGAPSVEQRAAALEERAAALARAADTVRAVESTAQRLKEADDRLADAAYRAGFRTPADAAEAVLPEARRRGLQHRVDSWRAEAAAVAERLREQDTVDAGARQTADPAAARAVHETADRALREASGTLAATRRSVADLAALSRQAEGETRRLGPLRERHDRVARLAGLTAGTSAENERRMRLESYVLAARLEQVAAAATARLARMSSGRYSLVHSDARAGGLRRSGLGLHVVDAWTGRVRDTATLSGGETFFASLALALGLADVVSDEAGGVRLDTLFIDEGFGTLDDQALDEVLDVLDSLRERDRSVGIVSHVADLRRRIPTQLEVVKQRRGSAVRMHTAAAPD